MTVYMDSSTEGYQGRCTGCGSDRGVWVPGETSTFQCAHCIAEAAVYQKASEHLEALLAPALHAFLDAWQDSTLVKGHQLNLTDMVTDELEGIGLSVLAQWKAARREK